MIDNITIQLPITSFLLDLKQLVKDTINETMQAQNNFGPHLTSNTPSDLLSRKELAKLLGISLPTLDARVKDGSIPHSRLGKKIRFDKNIVLQSIVAKGGKK